MPILQPIDKSLLRDTITVFNPFFTASDRDMPPEYKGLYTPTIIKDCYFATKSKRIFSDNGTQIFNTFSVYADMANSLFSKSLVSEADFKLAPVDKQEDTFFCFQKGMLVIPGEHEIFSSSKLDLDRSALEKQGYKLLEVNFVNPAFNFGEILFYHIGG